MLSSTKCKKWLPATSTTESRLRSAVLQFRTAPDPIGEFAAFLLGTAHRYGSFRSEEFAALPSFGVAMHEDVVLEDARSDSSLRRDVERHESGERGIEKRDLERYLPGALWPSESDSLSPHRRLRLRCRWDI